MSGGRFAGFGVATLLFVGACGGRAEVGSGDAGSGGGAADGAGGNAAGGRVFGAGGRPEAGAPPVKGGQPGSGAQPGFGGQGVGGSALVPAGGRSLAGGAPTFGGVPTFGGAPTFGGDGGVGCPPCKAPSASTCSYEVCDSATRKCVPVSREGQGCDDGNFCTVGEYCRAGVCQGGARNTCGAPETECQRIECNPKGFCSKVLQDGAVCKTGNADRCETGGRCLGGSCQPEYVDCSRSVPRDPCVAGQCNAATGRCETILLSGNPCSPIDLCALPGVCMMGKCNSRGLLDCSHLDTQCTRGQCQPGSGDCGVRNEPDGTSCVSDDRCVQGGVCASGMCRGGVRVTSCVSGDGCCPPGCSGTTDADCASTYLLGAVARGWWDSGGHHQSANDNTFTGMLYASTYNSYFTFDLTALSGEITGARLYLEVEEFYGADPSEQISLWDVSTDAATLENDASQPNPRVHSDLQSGLSYGTAAVYPTAVGSRLTIALGPAAVAHINAARGGYFSVGIHVDTLSGVSTSTGEGVRFSEASEFRANQLELDSR